MTTKYTKGHKIVFSATIDELLALKQCVDHAIKLEQELKDVQKICEPIEDGCLKEMSMSIHPATCEVSIDGDTYKVGFLPQIELNFNDANFNHNLGKKFDTTRAFADDCK